MVQSIEGENWKGDDEGSVFVVWYMMARVKMMGDWNKERVRICGGLYIVGLGCYPTDHNKQQTLRKQMFYLRA